MTKIYRFIFILIGIFLATCGRPYPGQVAKYTVGGDTIEIESLVEGGEAAWSPDGERFAYVNNGIRISDIEGDEEVWLTSSGHAPSWSPDGKRLVYADSGIWILEVAGKEKKRLTEEGHDPCWSADGERIIYAANGIWSIGVDGEGAKQLLEDGIDPACSPVGDGVLFEKFNPKRLEFDIWSSTAFEKPKLFMVNAESPTWSGDGRYIAYCSTGIWAATSDGSRIQRLTIYGHQPSYSPDGSKILFSFKDRVWLMDSPYNG